MRCLGVDSISEDGEYAPDRAVEQSFPEVSPSDIARRGGPVDMLLGMDVVNLHPTAIATRGDQRLLESGFGTGRILVGAVPGRPEQGLHVHAVMLTGARWSLPPGAIVSKLEDRLPSLLELEDLQPMVQPLCRTCKGCSSCSFRGSTFTPEEAKSVAFMEDTMAYDKKEQVIRVAYPLLDCADFQPDNRRQVTRIQENIERRV